MSGLEKQANSLDRLLGGNVIADHKDLAPYLDPKELAKLKSAGSYADEVIERMNTGASAIGLPTPWRQFGKNVLFKPSELSIWTGYKGHAKTMVLSQCMCNGMSFGEKVLVISPEFRPPTIIERKLRQCSGIRGYGTGYVQAWAEWANNKLWFYDHQGSVNTRYVLAAIRYARDKFGITQVVVDSLMKMGMKVSSEGFDQQKQFVDQLQTVAHDTGVHIHLVAHARKSSSGDDAMPGLHDIKGTSEIADMAENIYIVWTNKKKLDEMQNGNYAKSTEPDIMFKAEAQRNQEFRGVISLYMHPDSFQFVESLSAPPQVYFAETHVDF